MGFLITLCSRLGLVQWRPVGPEPLLPYILVHPVRTLTLAGVAEASRANPVHPHDPVIPAVLAGHLALVFLVGGEEVRFLDALLNE